MNPGRASNKQIFTSLTLLVSLLLTLLSYGVAVSFYTEQTAWLHTGFGLEDPSGKAGLERAGLNCGRIIVTLLALGLSWGTALLFSAVFRQQDTTKRIGEIWDEATPSLLSGTRAPESVFEDLVAAVPPGTRIGAVLTAWKGASPDADPEIVIEGNVAGVRHQLTFLQVLAGTLVLVGLIGNFFGLSAAVQQLPNLQLAAGAPAEPQAPKPTVQQADPSPLPGLPDIQKSTTASTSAGQTDAAAGGNEKLGGYLQSISHGLSVVVVSSVLGIFGMILLMLHAAWIKTLLNWTLTEEIALMTAEIAPVLRPPDRPMLNKMEAAVAAMARVPEELSQFTTNAVRLTDSMATAQENVQTIVGQLRQLIESDLTTTRETFDRYESALRDFTKIVQDDRATMATVGETALDLYGGLMSIGHELNSLVTTSNQVHQAYTSSHQGYETYVRAAAQSLADQQDKLREIYVEAQKQVETRSDALMSRFEHAMQGAMESVLNDLGNRLSRSYEDVENGLKRLHQDQIDSISRMQEHANQGFETLERRLEAYGTESLATLQSVLQGSRDNDEKSLALLEDARRTLLQGLERLVNDSAAHRLSTEEHHRAEMTEMRESMERLVRASEELLTLAQSNAGEKLQQAQQQWQGLYEVASTALTAAREESQTLYRGATERLSLALTDMQERLQQTMHARMAALERETSEALQQQIDGSVRHAQAAFETLSTQITAATNESNRMLVVAHQSLEQGGRDARQINEAVLQTLGSITDQIADLTRRASADLTAQHREEMRQAGLVVVQALERATEEMRQGQLRAQASWGDLVAGNLEQLEAVRRGVLDAGELWIAALNQQLGGLKAVTSDMTAELRRTLEVDSPTLQSIQTLAATVDQIATTYTSRNDLNRVGEALSPVVVEMRHAVEQLTLAAGAIHRHSIPSPPPDPQETVSAEGEAQ